MHIGSVPYLNALPLTFGVDYPIVYETPRKLREMIATGALDLALLSTVVLFESPQVYLVPGIGIGCKGAVKSVKLFFNKLGLTIQDLTNFKASSESNTANILTQVLLARPPLSTVYLTDADADLVIGDAAMTRPDPYGSVDLGEWWMERTGLPFVFASWISREKKISRTLWENLMATKTRNLEKLDACIAASPLLPELPLKTKHDYLRDNIHYDLGDEELSGLQKFRDECVRMRLIPNALPIQFAEII